MSDISFNECSDCGDVEYACSCEGGYQSPAQHQPSKLRNSQVWQRHTNDWYVEPIWTVDRLIDREGFPEGLHDPAAGIGTIVKAAQTKGLKASGADIVDRGAGFPVQDFLTCSLEKHENIVTNPPYGLLQEFTERALLLARHKVAILCPVARMNAARWLQDSGHLFHVLLITPRPSMPPGEVILRGEKPGGGKTDFCWLVFDKGYRGEPHMSWLRRDGAGITQASKLNPQPSPARSRAYPAAV